ncbi:MAG: histidine triad nucleotide-binding protein [Candidatus Uhrbacteria bacterium]
MDCLFCKIIAREIPASVRHEDADFVAFDDIHPKAPTHILIVPKRHIASVRELATSDVALAGRLVLAARAIAEEAGIAEGGYRIIMNCGHDGGQIIPHLHLHLMGGKSLQGIM